MAELSMRSLIADLRRTEAVLASCALSSALANGAAPEAIALLQARSTLAFLRAEQAADRLCSSTARPVATSGVCE